MTLEDRVEAVAQQADETAATVQLMMALKLMRDGHAASAGEAVRIARDYEQLKRLYGEEAEDRCGAVAIASWPEGLDDPRCGLSRGHEGPHHARISKRAEAVWDHIPEVQPNVDPGPLWSDASPKRLRWKDCPVCGYRYDYLNLDLTPACGHVQPSVDLGPIGMETRPKSRLPTRFLVGGIIGAVVGPVTAYALGWLK